MYALNDIVPFTELCTSDHIFQSSNAALTKQDISCYHSYKEFRLALSEKLLEACISKCVLKNTFSKGVNKHS